MNKNQILITILLILVIILLGCSYYQNISTNNKIKKTQVQINTLVEQNNLLKNSLFHTILSSNPLITETFKTKDNRIIHWKDIIDKNVLVFRFFDNSCSSCLDRELSNINSLENKGVPILILATFPNERALQSLLNRNKIKSPVYNLAPQFHLFSFEEHIPNLYIFFLSRELNIKYLYFPIQNDNEISTAYYQHIINEISL